MEESNKIIYDYLFQSITDTQNIIKSIDTKIGIILVTLSFPFSAMDKIRVVITYILSATSSQTEKILFVIIIGLFFISWVSAFLLSVKTLWSISNPSKNITGGEELKSIYYLSSIFKFKWYDVFCNRQKVKSTIPLSEIVELISDKNSQLLKALSFEKVKLSYIRDIKLLRQKYVFSLTLVWLVAGFLVYLIRYVYL